MGEGKYTMKYEEYVKKAKERMIMKETGGITYALLAIAQAVRDSYEFGEDHNE